MLKTTDVGRVEIHMLRQCDIRGPKFHSVRALSAISRFRCGFAIISDQVHGIKQGKRCGNKNNIPLTLNSFLTLNLRAFNLEQFDRPTHGYMLSMSMSIQYLAGAMCHDRL